MRIEFDPTNRDEATAVRAVLDAMYPTCPKTGATLLPAGSITKEDYDWPSEDGGVTVNLTEGTVTVATDTDSVPDLDANNEPHDPRIHSTPAKTNADGTWRAKRGVTADQVAAVRAEREAPEEPEGLTEIVEYNETLAYAPDQEQSAPPAPNAPAPAPTPPSAPPAPVADEPQVTISEPTFLDVMKAITAAQKAGKVDTAKVKELCAAIGAGDSTMGLNGADKGELRVQFMALLSAESGE